ncbi:MAG: LD-carboxypeptidase [Elainellaceae cyanobacterium]
MPSRRNLLTATAAGLLALAPRRAQGQALSVLRPPRLQPGDQVGIISPAGVTLQQRSLDIVVDATLKLGLVPRLGPHLRDRYGYLAGRDRDRAADVNQFFADPAIKALLPIRGDWGSARILPYLDYGVIRQNPKVVVGFSDITALLLGIHAQTGLVTFHGPHGLTSWLPNQAIPFQRVLFDGETVALGDAALAAGTRQAADRPTPRPTPRGLITPGQARGRLIGGNLSVIAGIAGSQYMPDLSGAVLFLEDVGEDVYRIDRMITQLKLAGVLDSLAGFIFGQCTRCSAEGDSLTLEQVLQDHIQPLGIPAWSGALIGHVEPILTLPLGIEVAIDAEQGVIQMLQPAVA